MLPVVSALFVWTPDNIWPLPSCLLLPETHAGVLSQLHLLHAHRCSRPALFGVVSGPSLIPQCHSQRSDIALRDHDPSTYKYSVS